jgi:hypothetical protein
MTDLSAAAQAVMDACTEITGVEDWMERYDEALNQLAK